jgi:hypothetical protein
MFDFRWEVQLPFWFDQSAIYTSPDIAACLLAVTGGALARDLGRLGVHVSPYVWRRCKRAFLNSIKWHVKRIFEWAKWYAHTMDSVYWSVLCALSVSTAVWLWLKLPIIRPLIYLFVPISAVTFTVLGWLDRGPRATRTVWTVLNFSGRFSFQCGVTPRSCLSARSLLLFSISCAHDRVSTQARRLRTFGDFSQSVCGDGPRSRSSARAVFQSTLSVLASASRFS